MSEYSYESLGGKTVNEGTKPTDKQLRQAERIYVAGPYCPKDCTIHDASRIAQHNTDKAIEVTNALIEKGHFVFTPHLSHYVHIHYSCKRDYGYWWYDEDMTFLKHWATALFFIAPSNGANAELAYAKKLGLKIYYKLDDVPTIWGRI